MTTQQERMLEDLRLPGFSPRTQEAYLGAVKQLAAHYHKPPDQLTEDELRHLRFSLPHRGQTGSPQHPHHRADRHQVF
jgi:integrase/recombinase XerD